MTRLFITAVVALCSGIFLSVFLRGPNPSAIEEVPVELDYADAVFDRVDGKPISISSFTADTLVLNFWATWCPPCKREMPWLNDIFNKYKNKNVQIVGIALDEKEPVSDFLVSNNIDFPILVGDANVTILMNSLGNLYGSLPFTVILDKNRKIVHDYLGELDEEAFENKLSGFINNR